MLKLPDTYDSPRGMDLQTEAIDAAAQAMQERLNKEIIGAWRAGYQYLHVYDGTPSQFRPETTFSVSIFVFPSISEKPPRTPDTQYGYTYDLTDIDREMVREHQ